MSDKEFSLFAIFVAIAAFFWYIWEKHKSIPPAQLPASEGGPVQDLNWPMSGVPAETFTPPSLGSLTVNVPNSALNSLSNQYIPLFGFVGMAQGESFS